MADTHLDRDVLSALQEVMEDEYPMLLETFLVDSEVRLHSLQEAGDVTRLIETAHSLKGSSSNMGAIHLARLCDELERLAKQNPTTGIEKLVNEISEEFAIVRPLYEVERQRSLAD